MTVTLDEKISALFVELNKQKEGVESAEKVTKQSWKTNCSIRISDSAPINIQTANQAGIIEVVAFLLNRLDYTSRAAEALGVPAPTTYESFTYSDWIDDCSKRIAVLDITTKRKSLQTLEDRLNAIVSPEQRRQMELDAITQTLLQ